MPALSVLGIDPPWIGQRRPSGAGRALRRLAQMETFRFAKRWLGVWSVAELLAFFLIVDLFGWEAAVFAQIASSVIGVLLLRRLGRDFRNALSPARGQNIPAGHGLANGAMSGLGAILLILPGFLSSLVALSLCMPPVRARLRRRLATTIAGVDGVPARQGSTLDLDASQWRPAPGAADADNQRLR